MNRKISIIIVNYNTRNLLFNCLKSIKESITIDYEVIVVDNDSQDGSVELCESFFDEPRFVLLRSGSNLGFAKANNLGAAIAKGGIFHFLNPDTELTPQMNADYKNVLLNSDFLYVNPLVNRDGSYENDKMPLPLLRDLFFWNISRKKARYWYKGASVIVSKENFSLIGKWCEDYFLYAEDLDLFFIAWKKGVRIAMLPSEIYHFGGGSSSVQWSDLEREVMVQKSNRLFFKKHFSKLHFLLVKLYFLLHNLFKRPSTLKFYLKAWQLSGK